MDSSGAEKTLPLAFPLPLCPGGVKAGGLPQYLPLGCVDKGGGLPANLRLMANKCRGSQETSNLCGCCKNQHINSWLHDGQKLWLEKKLGFKFLTAWLSETSAWLRTMRLLPLQNVQFPTAWLSEVCFLKENRMSTSWLHDCQKLEPEWKLNTKFPTACLSGTWF